MMSGRAEASGGPRSEDSRSDPSRDSGRDWSHCGRRRNCLAGRFAHGAPPRSRRSYGTGVGFAGRPGPRDGGAPPQAGARAAVRAWSDRYFIVVRDESTTTQSRLRRLPDGVRVTYARFGGAVSTAALFNGVSLFGAPSGGGTVTLANGQARWCVRLLPATGRIRVAAVGCP